MSRKPFSRSLSTTLFIGNPFRTIIYIRYLLISSHIEARPIRTVGFFFNAHVVVRILDLVGKVERGTTLNTFNLLNL